jgi:hypothetical protein
MLNNALDLTVPNMREREGVERLMVDRDALGF